MKKLVLLSVSVLVLLGSSGFALEIGPFTQAQVNAGRAQYGASCAGCHQADMKGRGEAPALAGSNSWAPGASVR